MSVGYDAQPLEQFLEGVLELRKVGPLLLQLPPSLVYDTSRTLRSLPRACARARRPM